MELIRLQKIFDFISELSNKWFNYLGWLLIISMIRVLTIFSKDTFDIIMSWSLYVVSVILVLIYSLKFILFFIPQKSTFFKIIIASLIAGVVGMVYGFVTGSVSELFMIYLFSPK
jgi:hypothetical protein